MAVRRRLGAPERSARRRLAAGQGREVHNNFLAWVEDATLTNEKDVDQAAPRPDRGRLRKPGRADLLRDRPLLVGHRPAAGLPVPARSSSPSRSAACGWSLLPLFFAGVGLLVPGAFLGNRAGGAPHPAGTGVPGRARPAGGLRRGGPGPRSGLRPGQRGNPLLRIPRISDTLYRVAEEMRAGRSRPDALRAMAERTNVEFAEIVRGPGHPDRHPGHQHRPDPADLLRRDARRPASSRPRKRRCAFRC